MARVNVYGIIESDNRTVTIGGRSANDSLSIRANTDNGEETDVAATLSATVVGNLRAKDRTKRNGGDNRRSVFVFGVPEVDAPASTSVRINMPTLDRAPADLQLSIGGTVVGVRELWALYQSAKGGA